jgi:GrpB-like predicted nucleotidyltransferase (UPF0157 family)
VGQRPAIYLISGPMGSGKSTVGRLLASRFERGVHLDADVFCRSIVSGRSDMTSDPSPGALEELHLRHRLGAAAADAYFEAGFTVALEDVVPAPLLGDYRTAIRNRPCNVVVLLPSSAAGAGFDSAAPRVGIWLDTTDLPPEETVDEILARTASSPAPIVVADYDEAWATRFDDIARPVRDALGGIGAEVEHIGSTSVPGLAAKPVIDIDVVVPSAEDVPTAIERLRTLGYVYQGDKGIKGREAFMWPRGASPHHLYVVVAGSPPHTGHIEFRNYLRQHPDVAQEYAALKKGLAERHRDDRLAYTEAKSEFVIAALQAADRDRRRTTG